MVNYDKWFIKPRWIMKLHPEETEDEASVNGELYAAEYAIHFDDYSYAVQLLGNLKIRNRSHDNWTSVLTLARMTGLLDGTTVKPYLKTFLFERVLHPRDLIYWWDLPSIFIFPFHLYTVLTRHKTRTWDGITRKILKTDGIKLMMLRNKWYLKRGDIFHRFIGRHVIEFILKKRFGENYVKAIMDIFFKHPDHPLRHLKRLTVINF